MSIITCGLTALVVNKGEVANTNGAAPDVAGANMAANRKSAADGGNKRIKR
jgi:hypothetical protein